MVTGLCTAGTGYIISAASRCGSALPHAAASRCGRLRLTLRFGFASRRGFAFEREPQLNYFPAAWRYGFAFEREAEPNRSAQP